MQRFTKIILAVALSCSLIKTAAAEESLPELREKLASLAKEVIKVVNSQPVAVGVFSPTGLPDANASPGIEGILTSELNLQIKGIVQRDAQYEVKGEYKYVRPKTVVDDPAIGSLRIIKIEISIQERNSGENLLTAPLTATLDSTRAIALFAQPTVALDPQGSKEARNAALEKAVQHPTSYIYGVGHTLVSSCPESKYSVELLAQPLAQYQKQPARARALRDDHGEAFVDIPQKQLYEIKLYNRDSKPVAATVSVDGLDVFNFSDDRREDGRPRFSHYIIHEAGFQEPDGHGGTTTYDGTLTIVGWHKSAVTQPNYLSFLVTGYGQGAVSQAGLASRGKVGVIHVQFSHCTPMADGSKPRSGNETGFGPPRDVKQKIVQFDVDPPHDFVSVRYAK